MSLEDDSIPAEKDSRVVQTPHVDDAKTQRLHERLACKGLLHLCWEEGKGVKRRIRASLVNKSNFGILVEAERPIATGTLVSVERANFAVMGRASVRHCTPKGLNYRIGLYMPDHRIRDL